MSSDFDSVLDAARRPEKQFRVCLRGDLSVSLEEAERALEQVTAAGATSLVDEAVQAAQAAVDAANAAVQDASVTFLLRGVSHRGWQDLVVANPPKEGDPADQAMGYNMDTFFPALARVCLIDPVLTDDQFTRLQDALSAGQWDALANACLTVSRRQVDVPFSRFASASTTG